MELLKRLREPRRFFQVITGPRQVGKTTLVQQVVKLSGLPTHFASADTPAFGRQEWLISQWEIARHLNNKINKGCSPY